MHHPSREDATTGRYGPFPCGLRGVLSLPARPAVAGGVAGGLFAHHDRTATRWRKRARRTIPSGTETVPQL